MLIQGSPSISDSQFLMMLHAAKQDEACTELEIKGAELDQDLVGPLIEILHGKVWRRIKISNCSGDRGSSLTFVNDALVGCCSSHQHIEEFQFHETTPVNSETIFAIAHGLRYAHNLKYLHLSVNTIDYEAGNWLARAIARNTWLETLNLSGTQFEVAAIGPLSFGLRLNRTLRSLTLDGCNLEDQQMSTILTALQDHSNLKTLSIQQNECHTEGMGAIAALLHYNAALEDLDMSYLLRKKKEVTPAPEPEDDAQEEQGEDETEGLEEEGKGQDGEAEEKNAQEGNEVDVDQKEEDEVKQSEVVSNVEASKKPKESDEEKDDRRVRNFTLKTFQLAGNALSDSFLEGLLNIFDKDSSLEELNLFGNCISYFGIQIILQRLPHLKHLKCLWLGHNRFGERGAQAVVDAMRTNYTLENVSVRSFADDLKGLQDQLDYYARLNRGGRRMLILGQSEANSQKRGEHANSGCNNEDIPLSLWPHLMERANRVYWGGSTSNIEDTQSHAADIIHCLVQGPVLFENPKIPL